MPYGLTRWMNWSRAVPDLEQHDSSASGTTPCMPLQVRTQQTRVDIVSFCGFPYRPAKPAGGPESPFQGWCASPVRAGVLKTLYATCANASDTVPGQVEEVLPVI